MRPILKGSTDQSVVIRIMDSTSGLPENAVEHNSPGIDLWYRREGETKTSIAEVALAALDSAHSDGGIELIGDGYYRLDLPDAAVAAGAGKNGVMVGGTVTDMIVIGCYVPLVDYNPYDSADLGLTTLADWADGGRLDLLLDAIPTTAMRGTDSAALAAHFTPARGGYLDNLSGGAPPTASQIQTEMEENGASVLDTIRDYIEHGTYGLSALKNLIDAIPTTAMRGTDNAALASVVGALADAAAAGEVTEADTLMQYIKQLINILIGAAGIGTFPAEAAPDDGVSLAEVIRAVHADATALNSGVYGLSALKTLIDAIKAETALIVADTEDLQGNVDTMHDTDLPAVKTVVDAIQAVTDAESGVKAVADAIKTVTDALPEGGALTTLLANVAAILTDTGTEGVVLKAAGLNADAVDEIFDEVVEGTLTFRQIIRIFLAVMAGKTTGGGTTTPTFRDKADSKARVSATVDANGNRTAMTLDGS